jgi:endonuclease
VLKSYREWLKNEGYADNTQAAQLHRVSKVEQYYGSLDDIYKSGKYDDLVSELNYSTSDERSNRKNPSKIIFDGNIRNNLQSYKNAVVRYRTFLTQGKLDSDEHFIGDEISANLKPIDEVERQRLGLERDMQAALRRDIALLESGLTIVDDGAERSVSSGFIDILCRDGSEITTVIELKAGKTDARVVGQILGYMGDLIVEDDEKNVRGIIVAHEFDKRTIAAAKAVPNLSLMRYSISFKFEAEC